LDHSGYLPVLYRNGYAGEILTTPASRDLCGIILPDSGHIQEEDARFANKKGYSKHKPALPLYTEDEARAALKRFEVLPMDRECSRWPGWTWHLQPAGHILGACSAHVGWGSQSLLFSGDLGRSDDLVMKAPAAPPAADVVVIESTYGDRLHRDGDVLGELAAIVNRTAARGGVLVIPAFAVGRAQTLLYCLHRLKAARRIPDMPVYLNSPMATDATRLYRQHAGEHRLSADDCAAFGREVTFVNRVEDSKALNTLKFPSIIVSASGMATGGRVLHHLRAYAPDARNTILFAGYQAAGTRGASLVGGAKAVKIFGEYVPVRAEVANLDMLSAHADRGQLLDWLASLPRAPRQVFVTHGEPVAADALRLAIEERFGWPCTVPEYRSAVEL